MTADISALIVEVTPDTPDLDVTNLVTEISLEPNDVELVVEIVETAVGVGSEGLQGPPGPASVVPGPTGPQGPPGTPGSAPQAYVHDQQIPSTVWVITHNLGYQPNVTVVDSASTTYEGEITYDSPTQITLTFSYSFAGKAYLS